MAATWSFEKEGTLQLQSLTYKTASVGGTEASSGVSPPLFGLAQSPQFHLADDGSDISAPSAAGGRLDSVSSCRLEQFEPLLSSAAAPTAAPSHYAASDSHLSKSVSDSLASGVFRRVSRLFFGSSTAVTPSDSMQSLDLVGRDNDPSVSMREQSRYLRRAVSSRNSVSSLISASQHGSHYGGAMNARTGSTASNSQSRRQRQRPTGPTGRSVSRSRRFLTAGFFSAKGTSAISLRDLGTSRGLPSPCGECPHCRRFLRMGERRALPIGPRCPCRICMIILEGNRNAPPMLKIQAAARKGGAGNKGSCATAVAPASEQRSLQRISTSIGAFCDHCSQSGFAPADGTCSRFSLLTAGQSGVGHPHLQPTITIYEPVAGVTAPTTLETVGLTAPAAQQPQHQLSTNTSMESLFLGASHRKQRHLCATGGYQAELRGGVTGSEVSIPTSVVVTNAHMCRICHMTADKDELLMSPCRCDGTLRHVHMSCLVHWLDICCKRLKKPAICELCAYRYRRRRLFKLKEFVWPRCRPMDKWLHIVFIFSLITMLVSALATVVCFQLEKALGVGLHASSPLRKATHAPAAAGNGSSSADAEEEDQRDERSLAAIQLVTLVAGVSFLLCFFVALYSQVKAKHSLYKYVKRAWETNHEWVIADYCAERDYQYVRRLANERAERRRQAFVASLTANAGPTTTADQQEENLCQQNVVDFSSPAQQTVAPP